MRDLYINALRNCTIKDCSIIMPSIVKPLDIEDLGNELRRDVQLGNVPHAKVLGVIIQTGKGIPIGDYITKAKGVNHSYAELYTLLNDVIFESAGDGCILSCSDKVRSDNGSLMYEGKGMSETPKCLVSGVDIIEFENAGASLKLMVAEGTGFVDFYQLSQELPRGYVPVAQYFNLTQFLAVKRYCAGDEGVKLIYKRKLNEDVLTSIIRKYADKLALGGI